jgi:hypothetical protein
MKLKYKKLVISLKYFSQEDVVCESYGTDGMDDYGVDFWD